MAKAECLREFVALTVCSPLVVAHSNGAQSQQSLGTVMFGSLLVGHSADTRGGAALLSGDQGAGGPLVRGG